jgi:DNA-binding NtrC family response regulator
MSGTASTRPAGGKPLRVLVIEDSGPDAELIIAELVRGRYDIMWERVQTADAMQAALQRATWDVILSDYNMPTFSAPAALEVLHSIGQDIPFLIISGTIGEETAVTALKAGAHDFFVKGRLSRLVPAIERALADVAGRRERVQADAEVQRLQDEIHRQRLRVFKATMRTVHDIVNNLLTSLQLVRLEAEGRLPADQLTLFDKMIADAAGKLRTLGDLETITERELEIGTGIDYPDTVD